MRVISGKCKGRPLRAVPGVQTRPTTDKVKETIFNKIGPYFDGGIGLDLFAGSGGLGIEALSRGLDQVIFVDKDHKAVQTIKSNLDVCGLRDQSEVYRNEAERALKAIIKREITLDIIFLDPPYFNQKIKQLLEIIVKNQLLSSEGVIVCEHTSELSLPTNIGLLEQLDENRFGGIGLTVYKQNNENE